MEKLVSFKKQSNIEIYNKKRKMKKEKDQALFQSRSERMKSINLKRRSERDAKISAEHTKTFIMDKATHGGYTASKAGIAVGNSLINLLKSKQSEYRSEKAAKKNQKLRRKLNK